MRRSNIDESTALLSPSFVSHRAVTEMTDTRDATSERTARNAYETVIYYSIYMNSILF